jgi:Protein of unknown function (DUF2917)
MDGYIVQGAMGLAHGGLVLIENGKGMLIEAWDGALWVTQGKDTRDYFVGPRGSFRLEHEGLVLVSALQPSRITLTAPVPAYYAKRIVLIQSDAAPRALYERSRERGGWLSGLGYRLARSWTNAYAPYSNPTAAAL